MDSQETILQIAETIEIQDVPEIVPEITEIAEIVEIGDRVQIRSEPASPPFLRALSAVQKDIKRTGGIQYSPCVPLITTEPKSEAQRMIDRQCTTKAKPATGLHKKTTNRYMMLAMHRINPLHDPHSHQDT